MRVKKNLTKEQALQKLKHYCGYQERCHKEVRDKLFDLGVWKKEHDEIISALIEEKYLDEERFAIAYAGGRFRIKGWGKVKIRYALQQKQVSEYSVNKALKNIPEEEYVKAANELAIEKYEDLKHEQPLARKKKTIDHLVSRGYEYELVARILQKITTDKS